MRITCGKCLTRTETDCMIYVNGLLTCPNCMEPLTGDTKEGFRVFAPREGIDEKRENEKGKTHFDGIDTKEMV